MERGMKVLGALAVFVLLTSLSGNAQQLSRRSQFMINQYLINPAAAGTQNFIPFKASYRSQWTGFDGAPTTITVSGNAPLPNGFGIGGIIFQDNAGGAVSRTGLEMTGAYKVNLNRENQFSFGLSAVLGQFAFDNSTLVVQDQDDDALNGFQKETAFLYDANVGFKIYGETYSIGLAVPNLIGTQLNIDRDASTRVNAETNENVRHFFVMGTKKFEINKTFDIEGTGLVKVTPGIPGQFDFGARAIYLNSFFAGFTARIQDSFSLMGGMDYEGFFVAYNYDISTNGAKSLSPHTHEITVGYSIERQRKGFKTQSFKRRRTF